MASCDTRCTSGQEGTCVCSCGGDNHGCAKKIYDIVKDGGNADVKGAGLDLHLAETEGGQVQVWNRGVKVQVYKSEKEFVKDLGKLIVAGQVDVNATDAYNRRQIDLKGVQGKDPEAGKKRLEKMREPTVNEAFDQIRATGAKVTRKDGEFRVNVPGGTEGTAYYTDDAKDAIGTAKVMMSAHGQNKKFSEAGSARTGRSSYTVQGANTNKRYHVLARDDGRVLHSTDSPMAAKKWADSHSDTIESDNYQSVYDAKTERVVYDGSSDGKGTVLEDGFI